MLLAAATLSLAEAQMSARPAPGAVVHAEASSLKPVLPASLIQYFAGRWSGSGSFARSGKPVASVYDFEPGLEREDMIIHYREKEPATFAYDGLISIDGVTGELVLMMAGNLKGGARLFKSKGWLGDSLVFQSTPSLRASFALERFTFLRESPERFRAIYEMSIDDGLTWHVGDEQTFTKS